MQRSDRRWTWIVAMACGIAFQPCARAARLKIVTSFVPAYCFAVNVAGDLAEVENLLPPMSDPHDYQLTPRDLEELTRADIAVVNGLELEGWLPRAMSSAGGGHFPRVAELAAGLGTNELIYEENALRDPSGGPGRAAEKRFINPHIWLDPTFAARAVTNICQALEAADPAHAAAYARNADAYCARLRHLDGQIAAAAAGFVRREIVTDHNAFPYFARRYGLTVAGVVEVVDEVPPSPRELARLERTIRAKGIRVIFASPPEPPREARQIASDLGIEVSNLNTIEIGPLRPDTYEVEMLENLKVLEGRLR